MFACLQILSTTILGVDESGSTPEFLRPTALKKKDILRWKMEKQSPSTALWRLEKLLWVGNLPIVWNTGS